MGTTVFVRLFDSTGDNVLLVHNLPKSLPNGSIKHEGWGMPGGGVRPGETPHQAALRECDEETGLSVEIDPEPFHIDQRGPNHIVAVFNARGCSGNPQPRDKDIVEAEWVFWRWLIPADSTYGFHKGRPIYQSHIRYININNPQNS